MPHDPVGEEPLSSKLSPPIENEQEKDAKPICRNLFVGWLGEKETHAVLAFVRSDFIWEREE